MTYPTLVQRISIKAVLVNQGKVLLLRKALYEGNGGNEGKWNLPGGKVEPGMRWDDALRQELLEETGISEFIFKMPIYVGEWRPTVSGVPTQIICTFIVCETKYKEVSLNREHDAFEWILPEEHVKFNILPPEDKVIDRFKELNQKGLYQLV